MSFKDITSTIDIFDLNMINSFNNFHIFSDISSYKQYTGQYIILEDLNTILKLDIGPRFSIYVKIFILDVKALHRI